MFDDDFFNTMERKVIPDALKEINNPETNWFWCDGVVPVDDIYFSKKFVNDNRYILLKAYFGNEGQTEYEFILYFGPKALSRYARDLTILECIPDTDASEWFFIDVQNKKIEIQLL